MWVRRTPLALLLLAALAPGAAAQPAAALDPRVASALELARAWLEAQRAYDAIPGISAAIVHDQQILWSGAFGLADVAAQRPATADTLYSICSISKLFTSVAVMQQRDAGKLHIEDPVGKYLPWYRLQKMEGEGDVTIEGLLTHASGLPRESDYPYWSAPDFRFPTHDEIVQKLPSQSALYTPETRFQYSNLGLTLAGEIVAATSGTPYPEYVRKNILDPLGLRSTTPEMPEAERGKRLATGYSALDRQGKRKALPFFLARGIAPAAGYASNAEDLARFAQWQLRLLEKGGTEVLKATTLREMYRVHWAEPDFKTLWGLGFAIRRDGEKTLVGHGGSCPGYRTALLLVPEDRVAIVFLANAQGVDSGKWAKNLYDIVAPALRDAKKDAGKGSAPDPSLSRYAGAYDSQPWGGETVVIPWGEGLAILDLPTMNPMEDLEKLKKVGEHRFRVIHKDETLGEEIVFEMGPDGHATRYIHHSNISPRIR
jgi:CubicO group peptidase (beta-lactamase class C family)